MSRFLVLMITVVIYGTGMAQPGDLTRYVDPLNPPSPTFGILKQNRPYSPE